ncbi:hypothetical protein H4R20_004521 [Coemansia guatemalensis]|uniref:Uncharacterized protein n=1 Tax=Coemansia guatemalensis TaxID=2761395 RepID=A0A9W8HXF6_9FUNG|nr:hypothetical protein H4R20_004521 [Coemansia guatemalensis]
MNNSSGDNTTGTGTNGDGPADSSLERKTPGDDGGGIEELATAVETMCEGFDRQCQRQRTLSWVSSALSSTGASTAGAPQDNPTESGLINRERQMAASGRQHVRLTTIDPVTGSIIEAIGASGQGQQTPQHEAALAGSNAARTTGLVAVDPGYIEKVFIKPNILYTAIPPAPPQPPRTYPGKLLMVDIV